jgi:hypothetical protein
MTARKAATRITCLMAGILAMAAAPAIAGTIPSGGPPSPLFGATPFSQPMPIFEEFGTRPMPATACSNCAPVPVPASCTEGPTSTSLDAFLQQQPLAGMPMRVANKSSNNPWLAQITKCLPKVKSSPAEGRPSGE